MFDHGQRVRTERHPVINLIVLLLMVGLGFIIVGPIFGFFAALPFFPGSMLELAEAIQSPMANPSVKIPLYIIQGFATATGLIIAPAIFLQSNQSSLAIFFQKRRLEILPIVVTIMVVIIFMAVNSIFIEWNARWDFPEFADGFERWARQREDDAAELTKFLTEFGSPGELMLAIVIIAILPAIGEEIVFRGLIQNEIHRGTGNIHLSIWVAAILFSAIHFQFFGFVPRLLLGALFGYLYYWSGNLMIAIIAHFINNGVSVVALYFYQQGKFSFDLESQQSAPISIVVMSAVLTVGLLYYFYQYFNARKISAN